jgi:AcrR family transcriptional regulator
VARDPRSVDARRKDILVAAEEVITRLGYNETSLDMIVEKAGCSKTMIYSYFGNKQGLLSAMSEEVMRGLADALSQSTAAHLDVEDALLALARRTLELVLSGRHIAVVQVIVSNFLDTPSVGQAYFDLGPRGAQRELSNYLKAQVRQGTLAKLDTDYAARQFFALVLWDHLHASIVGVGRELSKKKMDTEARRAVAAFLQLYPPLIL